MRLSQHTRLLFKLRKAKADGDVLTIGRIQTKLGDQALLAAEREQRRRPQRINLKDSGAPSPRDARRLSSIGGPIAAATVTAVATFPPRSTVHELTASDGPSDPD